MKVQITRPSQEQYIQAFNTGDFEQVERLEEEQESQWEKLFDAIMNGENDYLYYDMHHGSNDSFMRYVLHRSAKKDNHLQLTTLYHTKGEVLPNSDRQFQTFEDFKRELPNAESVFLD